MHARAHGDTHPHTRTAAFAFQAVFALRMLSWNLVWCTVTLFAGVGRCWLVLVIRYFIVRFQPPFRISVFTTIFFYPSLLSNLCFAVRLCDDNSRGLFTLPSYSRLSFALSYVLHLLSLPRTSIIFTLYFTSSDSFLRSSPFPLLPLPLRSPLIARVRFHSFPLLTYFTLSSLLLPLLHSCSSITLRPHLALLPLFFHSLLASSPSLFLTSSSSITLVPYVNPHIHFSLLLLFPHVFTLPLPFMLLLWLHVNLIHATTLVLVPVA
ncbi:hypothetical protein BDQ17DRAFT_690878 [Cyathus striatus]|nr:hypothetical protein BDQ17DRAFT_690878 [Cyathus striatus]